MATSKLALFNLALGHLGKHRIVRVDEATEPRRVLDDYWDQVLGYCLERKMWNFTFRSLQIDASDSIVPQFGYLYAFPIPSDWIRTRQLSASPTLAPQLLDYKEEAGYWYTNVTPIFVEFNSNDVTYGLDLSMWPASFADYVALRLATQACLRINGNVELLGGADGLLKREEKAYKVAAANCAMNEPVGFAPMSGWVRSRRGYMTGMPGPGGDEPTGGSLIP